MPFFNFSSTGKNLHLSKLFVGYTYYTKCSSSCKHIKRNYGAVVTLRLLDLLLFNANDILSKLFYAIRITKRLKVRSIGHIERCLRHEVIIQWNFTNFIYRLGSVVEDTVKAKEAISI